jgi:hypothetical protein
LTKTLFNYVRLVFNQVQKIVEPKKALTFLLILCFAVALVQEIVTVKAEPETIVVPYDNASIKEAIDVASEGDTVFVKKGTYEFPVNQTLIINKTISFVGEDAESTIINLYPPWVPTGGYHLANGGVEPDYGYDKSIKVMAENVKISGFTIVSNPSTSLFVAGQRTQITGNVITQVCSWLVLSRTFQITP